jgi:ABC transport system ATP-binding/permease protein
LFFEGDGKVVEVPGNYSYWEEREKERLAALKLEERKEREREQALVGKARPAAEKKGLSFKERKEFEGLEARIMAIEERLEGLDEQIAAVATDYEKVQSLHEEKLALEEELESAMERWAELGERA